MTGPFPNEDPLFLLETGRLNFLYFHFPTWKIYFCVFSYPCFSRRLSEGCPDVEEFYCDDELNGDDPNLQLQIAQQATAADEEDSLGDLVDIERKYPPHAMLLDQGTNIVTRKDLVTSVVFMIISFFRIHLEHGHSQHWADIPSLQLHGRRRRQRRSRGRCGDTHAHFQGQRQQQQQTRTICSTSHQRGTVLGHPSHLGQQVKERKKRKTFKTVFVF